MLGLLVSNSALNLGFSLSFFFSTTSFLTSLISFALLTFLTFLAFFLISSNTIVM